MSGKASIDDDTTISQVGILPVYFGRPTTRDGKIILIVFLRWVCPIITACTLAACAMRVHEPVATVSLPDATSGPPIYIAPVRPPVLAIPPSATPMPAEMPSPTPNSPVRVLPVTMSAAQLRARVQREGRPLFVDGNVLTFVYEGDVDRVTTCCSVQLPMTRLPGSTVWVLSLEVRDLSWAMMSYGFYVRDEGKPLNTQNLSGEWRGANAPPAPRVASPLSGHIETFDFTSPSLGELRRVDVYFPPGYDKSKHYAAIYMADGEFLQNYAERYEPLLKNGEAQPLLLIGMHASDTPERNGQPSGRWQEYLPNSQPGQMSERYPMHAQFVVRELIPWAEREFHISSSRADRAVFGTSNGAVWAANMGLSYGNVFGTVIAFSMGVSPGQPAAAANPPRYYLSAGTLEEGFLRVTATHSSALQRAGIPNTMTTRVSGHDLVNWELAWVDAIRLLFPPGRG